MTCDLRGWTSRDRSRLHARYAIVFPTLWGYLWFTRDLNLDAITPKEEITRYFTLTMWISIYTFAVHWAGSYFAEQDNSWHQD